MRHGFSLFLATLFVILLPITLLLAIPRLNGFGIDRLEQRLDHGGAYDRMSAAIQEYASQADAEGQTVDARALSMVVSREFDREYVREKVEGALDQIAAWAADPELPEPQVSFNDLKSKLVTQHPELKAQIDEALAKIEAQQAEDNPQLPQSLTELDSHQVLDSVLPSDTTLDQTASGDWTFGLGHWLAALPALYQIYMIAVPLLAILVGLCFGGSMALSRPGQPRRRLAGWTLIIAGIWNALVYGLVWFILIQDGLLRAVPLSGVYGEMAKAIWRSLRDSLLAHISLIEVGATVVLLVTGVILLWLAQRRKGDAPSEQKAAPRPIETAPAAS